MPSELYKVSAILGREGDSQVTVDDFNHFTIEINKALSEIALAIGKARGQDNAVPKLENDMDLDGNNIINVGQVKFNARTHTKNEQVFNGIYRVTQPVAAPSDATALRNDLAANVIPNIEAALNNLGLNLKRVLALVKV